jgi:hypothetical protein
MHERITRGGGLLLSLAGGLSRGAMAVGISFGWASRRHMADPDGILYTLHTMETVAVMNAIATFVVILVLQRDRKRAVVQALDLSSIAPAPPGT